MHGAGRPGQADGAVHRRWGAQQRRGRNTGLSRPACQWQVGNNNGKGAWLRRALASFGDLLPWPRRATGRCPGGGRRTTLRRSSWRLATRARSASASRTRPSRWASSRGEALCSLCASGRVQHARLVWSQKCTSVIQLACTTEWRAMFTLLSCSSSGLVGRACMWDVACGNRAVGVLLREQSAACHWRPKMPVSYQRLSAQ